MREETIKPEVIFGRKDKRRIKNNGIKIKEISMKKLIIICLVFVFAALNIDAQKTEFTTLTGPYLGQKPPGLIPILFAPEIFRQVPGNSVHSAPSFSYDGKEMYYTVMSTEGPFLLKYMRMIDNKWTKPVSVPFAKNIEGHNSFFANNNDIIIFKAKSSKYDESYVSSLWKTERENGVWETPVEMDAVFDGLSMGISITKSGALYYTLKTDGSCSYDVYKSQLVNGKYNDPEKLGPQINSDDPDWQPFIAPDESYIIFSRYKGEPKKGITSLFVSFKDLKGNWTEAMNMGDSINLKNAGWPYVSPDGKYFFFVSSRDNDSYFYKVYWVSAEIIEGLKLKRLKQEKERYN